MLEAQNLSFRYEKNNPWLFENISFSINPGEIVGLPGPSGRGKTTLAKILCGFLPKGKGSILIDQKPILNNGAYPVQMIFQHPELSVNPHWKTAEILKEGYSPPRRLLTAFEVEDEWLERYPWELSGGQLARICLVRALGPDTRFIAADEMTAMLDAVTQARIWKSLVEHVRKENIGMLVISHDKHLISGICDRTITYFDTLHAVPSGSNA